MRDDTWLHMAMLPETRRQPTRPAWFPLLLPTIAYVLGIAAQSTFLFFLAPAYARAYGLGTSELFAFAASALASMAVGVPAGRLADRVPRRRAMRLGWAMEAAAALWLALMPASTLTLVLAAAGMGGGLGFGSTAFQSYVADVIRGRSVANGYATTSAFALLGSAAGPLSGAVVLATLGAGDTGVRVLAGILAAAAAAGALATIPLPSMRTAESARAMPVKVGFLAATVQAFDPHLRRSPDTPALRASERRSLSAYAIAFATLGFGYGLTAPWVGPHLMDEFALPPAGWGALLGWSTVFGASAIYLTGVVARRYSAPLRLTLATNVVTALTMVGFALASHVGLAAAFFLARQFFGNVTGPLLSTGLALDVSEETRGRSFGLMNVAWNLPWAVGAGVGGVLLALIDGWTFVIGAVCLVVGPLAALVLAQTGEGAAGRRARRRAPAAD